MRKQLILLVISSAVALNALCGTNFVTSVEIDGQKLEGSYQELGVGDGKILKIKSRKALQLQTIEVTATLKIPHAIKYEKLAGLYVRSNYACDADVFFRRLSLYNIRAKRWLALERGEMTAGIQRDEAKIQRFADYVTKETREVQVRIYLERTGDQPFLASFDHFTFAGTPQPIVSAHKQAKEKSDVVKLEPNVRVHEAVEGSGITNDRVDQLRSDFKRGGTE